MLTVEMSAFFTSFLGPCLRYSAVLLSSLVLSAASSVTTQSPTSPFPNSVSITQGCPMHDLFVSKLQFTEKRNRRESVWQWDKYWHNQWVRASEDWSHDYIENKVTQSAGLWFEIVNCTLYYKMRMIKDKWKLTFSDTLDMVQVIINRHCPGNSQFPRYLHGYMAHFGKVAPTDLRLYLKPYFTADHRPNQRWLDGDDHLHYAFGSRAFFKSHYVLLTAIDEILHVDEHYERFKPLAQRDKRGIFRGSPVSPKTDDFDQMLRTQIVKLTDDHPDLIDAYYFVRPGRIRNKYINKDTLRFFLKEYTSEDYQRSFAYTIVSDGSSKPDRLIRQMLYGSLILKEMGEVIDYWYLDVLPFVHFVPFVDIDDLLLVLKRLPHNQASPKKNATVAASPSSTAKGTGLKRNKNDDNGDDNHDHSAKMPDSIEWSVKQMVYDSIWYALNNFDTTSVSCHGYRIFQTYCHFYPQVCTDPNSDKPDQIPEAPLFYNDRWDSNVSKSFWLEQGLSEMNPSSLNRFMIRIFGEKDLPLLEQWSFERHKYELSYSQVKSIVLSRLRLLYSQGTSEQRLRAQSTALRYLNDYFDFAMNSVIRSDGISVSYYSSSKSSQRVGNDGEIIREQRRLDDENSEMDLARILRFNLLTMAILAGFLLVCCVSSMCFLKFERVRWVIVWMSNQVRGSNVNRKHHRK